MWRGWWCRYCTGRLMPWGSFLRRRSNNTEVPDCCHDWFEDIWQVDLHNLAAILTRGIAIGVAKWWRPSWLIDSPKHAAEWPKGRSEPIRLSSSHPDCKGSTNIVSPTIPQVLVGSIDECINNVVRSTGRYDVVTHVGSFFFHMFL